MAKKKKTANDGIAGMDKMLGGYIGDLLKKGVAEAGIDIDQMSPEDYQLIFGGMTSDDEEEPEEDDE